MRIYNFKHCPLKWISYDKAAEFLNLSESEMNRLEI